MQSREPRAGEANRLPGTLFLTCPVCATTHTILRPTEPTGPWFIDCACGIPWRVRDGLAGTVWFNRRFDPPTPGGTA